MDKENNYNIHSNKVAMYESMQLYNGMVEVGGSLSYWLRNAIFKDIRQYTLLSNAVLFKFNEYSLFIKGKYIYIHHVDMDKLTSEYIYSLVDGMASEYAIRPYLRVNKGIKAFVNHEYKHNLGNSYNLSYEMSDITVSDIENEISDIENEISEIRSALKSASYMHSKELGRRLKFLIDFKLPNTLETLDSLKLKEFQAKETYSSIEDYYKPDNNAKEVFIHP